MCENCVYTIFAIFLTFQDVRFAEVARMQSSGHSHISVFEVDHFDGRGLITLLIASSDIVMDAPCIEGVTWAGKDGHGK